MRRTSLLSSRRRLYLLLGVAVILLVVWLLREKKNTDDNHRTRSDTSQGSNTSEPTPPGSSAGDPIEVFFSHTYANDPNEARNDNDNIDHHLAAFIASAQKTLDCAFFELESERLAGALIAAKKRGVRVRLVGDSDYRDNPEMKEVIAAGIPVVFDERSALMHNKFVVADKERVWTGSYNATDNCSFKNNNNAMILRSADVADDYATEFAEMFERGEFGPKSTSNTPHSFVKIGDADVSIYFSPEDDVPPKIIRILNAAKERIHFMAFSFADDAIGDALMDATSRRSVSVEGVVEKTGSSARGGEYKRLLEAGIPVLTDGNSYVMHHKVFIIDDTWVITGSYNFSASAARSNDENLLIIKSPRIAGIFEGEYQRIRGMALRSKKTNI